MNAYTTQLWLTSVGSFMVSWCLRCGRKFWPTIVNEHNIRIKNLLLPIVVDFSCTWIPYMRMGSTAMLTNTLVKCTNKFETIEPADCKLNDVFSHRKTKESAFQKSKLTVFILLHYTNLNAMVNKYEMNSFHKQTTILFVHNFPRNWTLIQTQARKTNRKYCYHLLVSRAVRTLSSSTLL